MRLRLRRGKRFPRTPVCSPSGLTCVAPDTAGPDRCRVFHLAGVASCVGGPGRPAGRQHSRPWHSGGGDSGSHGGHLRLRDLSVTRTPTHQQRTTCAAPKDRDCSSPHSRRRRHSLHHPQPRSRLMNPRPSDTQLGVDQRESATNPNPSLRRAFGPAQRVWSRSRTN